MQNKLRPEMKSIENKLWKHFQYDINNGNLKLSRSDNAWFLTPQTSSKKNIEKYEKGLAAFPKNVGQYVDPKGRYILAPLDNAQDEYNFAEVKAVLAGEMLLAKKKEVLELMKSYSEELKELAKAKKQLETA